MINLPVPEYDAKYDLNKAMQHRRSVREFKEDPLTLVEVGQLLWAAQGVTTLGGFRTAPSAGALYPIESYLVVGQVQDLNPGIYRYDFRKHILTHMVDGDRRNELAVAALDQTWMAVAPAMLALAAVYERTTERYGERGVRYIHMEIGHAAENVSLEAVALNLGTVVVAAFSDMDVKKALGLPAAEHPLCLMPVGRKK